MLQRTGNAQSQRDQEQDTPQGIKARIAKLRWAGMDRDAEELCHRLEDMAPEDCVPPGPAETD